MVTGAEKQQFRSELSCTCIEGHRSDLDYSKSRGEKTAGIAERLAGCRSGYKERNKIGVG